MCDGFEASPLGLAKDKDFQRLGKILWDWDFCGGCSNTSVCANDSCPWSRSQRLTKYRGQYQAMTDSYVPDFYSDTPALGSHKALSDLIQTIKDNRNVPKKSIMQQMHGAGPAGGSSEGLAADQSRALNIASSVLCLTDWRSGEDLEALAEDIIPLAFWRDSASITEFVGETFPERVHPLFESVSSRRRIVSNLNVRRLEKAGLHIEATTDVRRHLELDLRERVVRMYDCTPVLKEVLMTSQSDTDTLVIPRGLVVEILETIYEVLFPPDRDSWALLWRYVTKQGLDEDMLRYEVAKFRSKDDHDIKFEYFGTRLANIYEELQNPTPRTALEAWFERKSGSQRNMLIATMIGVFIAVVIGILGLGVAAFQAWLAWQQWKHPVKDS